MTINRISLVQLYQLINNKKDIVCDVNTQYKLMKIKKRLEEEIDIYNEQISSLQSYCKKDENGNFIMDKEGNLAIKEESIEDCNKIVNDLNLLQITLPDIYFSLEELTPLQLSLEEFELLYPFIKN